MPGSAADTDPDVDADAGLGISLDKLPRWSATGQLEEGTATCSNGLEAGIKDTAVVAGGWGEAAVAAGSTAWSGVCVIPDIGASGVLDRDIDRGVCERD